MPHGHCLRVQGQRSDHRGAMARPTAGNDTRYESAGDCSGTTVTMHCEALLSRCRFPSPLSCDSACGVAYGWMLIWHCIDRASAVWCLRSWCIRRTARGHFEHDQVQGWPGSAPTTTQQTGPMRAPLAPWSMRSSLYLANIGRAVMHRCESVESEVLRDCGLAGVAVVRCFRRHPPPCVYTYCHNIQVQQANDVIVIC